MFFPVPRTDAALKRGSSRITGKGGFDLEKEVVAVPVSISHAFDDLDTIFHTLRYAGVEMVDGTREKFSSHYTLSNNRPHATSMGSSPLLTDLSFYNGGHQSYNFSIFKRSK